MPLRLGARWDDPAQDERISRAKTAGDIDYIEVNWPIPYGATPDRLGLPIIAHTSSNATCSVHGVNPSVAAFVRDGAAAAESPWVGEHLTWLGSASTGSLGYQINPLFTEDFKDVAVANVRRLAAYYGRKVALELGPIYLPTTGLESELHFLGAVAREADAAIILDVTHWTIANRNLGRPLDYAFDALDAERIVELHVAGMRQGADGYWHDYHQALPNDDVLAMTKRLVAELPALEAVTFEHHATAPEDEFFEGLGQIGAIVADARGR